MDLALRNKSVAITGGNRGIGRAIALAFAEEGGNVTIGGRDNDAMPLTMGTVLRIGTAGPSLSLSEAAL